MRQRIEQALRELPLSDRDIAKVATRLANGWLIRNGRVGDDSPFFDFRGKVLAVVEHFREDGLTLDDYLRAAVKKPGLFTQAPATLIGNIEAVAEHFRADGLVLADYLQAALRHPSLFTQLPATIIGHVHLLMALYRDGLVRFPRGKPAPPEQPLRPLFDFLLKKPSYFCLAEDNYVLRAMHGNVTGRGLSGSLLTQRRESVERELAAALGQNEAALPVRKEVPPPDGGDREAYARNLLLRALIREGLIKGTLER